MTPMMKADELAQAFNAATERQNWRAYVGGTRNLPTVIFKSKSAMVELTYFTENNTFQVAYFKATCSFGDFMGSSHRSLLTVLTALKASGYPVSAPLELDDGVLRIEYDPKTKTASIALAGVGDDWQQYAPKLPTTADENNT